MQRIRAAAVAGSFYPAEPHELKALLDGCFTSHRLGPQGKKFSFPSILGGMVPHAGYVYSGPCAAHFYSRLDPETKRVILLGVNHRARGARAACSRMDYWETPLGKVKIDQELTEQLKNQCDFLESDERPHLREHSLEVQLPFLQSVLADFALLPLSLSYLSAEECKRLGQAIARVYESEIVSGKKTIVIASSDLSHYLPPEETENLDRIALDRVLALDPSGLLKTVEKQNISMCGVVPTAALLFVARTLGVGEARLLKHCHSGDFIPMQEVVGYASVAIEL